MRVHLLDGTYELFRHFYGLRRFHKGEDKPFGAVKGVLKTVLQMIEGGATHLGVATDHVVESFRNGLWPGYKTSEGIEPALLAQFHPLESALEALGVAVWPMVELEADDALASAARIASADVRVQKVCIWTPDKDLAQCVRGARVDYSALQADPKRSIFRIYRDTRFSRDRSPYTTRAPASFPFVEPPSLSGDGAPADEGAHGNGGYFNFEPGNMYAGGGMWMPARPRLEAFRQGVRDEPERVRGALEDPGFILTWSGARTHDELKRVPAGYPADHPLADMFRWKDVIFGRRLSDHEEKRW